VGAASEKKEASVGDYHGLPSGGLWRTLVEATGRLGVMERETNPEVFPVGAASGARAKSPSALQNDGGRASKGL
jgi:hypothetical protein